MSDINRSLKKEKLLSALSTVSVVLLSVLILGLFIVGLYKINVITLPPFLEKLFGGHDDSTDIPGNEYKIYDAISGSEVDAYVVATDISGEEMLEMLKSSSLPDTFTLTNEVVYQNGSIQTVYKNIIWKSGNRYRIDTYKNGTLTSGATKTDAGITVTDYLSGQSSSFKDGNIFDVYTGSGMPNPSKIVSDGTAKNMQIKLLRTSEYNMYLLEYDYPELNQHDTVYISPDYGIAMSAKSECAGKTVYTHQTTELAKRLVKNGIPADEREIFE